MIVQNNIQENRTLGFDDTVEFTISQKHLAKVFRLISTSTYKDVYGSTVRELTSNAVDAMVEAGRSNEPVYVKYNSITSEISIVDNGIGMSEEFIREKYKDLGETTKDLSSDLIGGFGVGRFSVFSYYEGKDLSAQYSLISRWNGVKTEYIISLNNRGLPEADLVSRNVTGECNGTEVKFTILRSDFQNFKEACKNQLKYFKTVVFEDWGIDNSHKLIQGKNFIYRPDRENYSNNLEICWGNIYYPIDFNWLNISPLKINCALYFPQSIPFDPEVARESLRHTEENKNLILSKIEELKTEIQEIFSKQEYVENMFELFDKNNSSIKLNEYSLHTYGLTGEYKWKKHPRITNKNCVKIIRDVLESFPKTSGLIIFYDNLLSKKGRVYYNDGGYSTTKIRRNVDDFYFVFEKKSLSYFGKRSLLKNLGFTEVEWDEEKNLFLTKEGVSSDYIDEVQKDVWEEVISTFAPVSSVFKKRERKAVVKRKDDEIYCKTTQSSRYNTKLSSYFKNFIYVVTTNEKTEFEYLEKVQKAVFYTYKKYPLFIGVLHAKKYNGKISKSTSFNDFLRSDLMIGFYKKIFLSQEIKDSGRMLQNVSNTFHHLHQNKFISDFYINFYHCFPILNNLLEEYKETFYKEGILVEEYKKQILKWGRFYNMDTQVLKYKLLYEFYKNRYEIKTNRKQLIGSDK